MKGNNTMDSGHCDGAFDGVKEKNCAHLNASRSSRKNNNNNSRVNVTRRRIFTDFRQNSKSTCADAAVCGMYAMVFSLDLIMNNVYGICDVFFGSCSMSIIQIVLFSGKISVFPCDNGNGPSKRTFHFVSSHLSRSMCCLSLALFFTCAKCSLFALTMTVNERQWATQ